MNYPLETICTGIGVLADGCLLTWHPGSRVVETHTSAAIAVDIVDLFSLAMDYKLNSVWLCPGSAVSLHLNTSPQDFVPEYAHDLYKITVKRRDTDGVPQSAQICPRTGQWGHKPFVYVMLPDHDPTWLEDQDNAFTSWSLSDVEIPKTFLATLISIYEKTGGSYLSTSPASTGVQAMKSHTKTSDWIREDGEACLPSALPTQLYWHRKLLANEEGLYLHRYDRNAMYLAACTGSELGIGAPTSYLDAVEAPLAWRQSSPVGLWHCTITGGYEGFLRPHKKEWEGTKWLTTSGVRALHNLDYHLEIHAAHIWESAPGTVGQPKITKHRRVLQPWAKAMWDARQALKEKYGKENPAYRLMKMIANRGMGWLDLHMLSKQEKPKWYAKAHWYAEIMGLAQYRMTITMQDIRKAYGAWPVLIYADAFCYLSSEPDPRQAFPDLVRRKTELGGFKPDLSLRVDAELLRAFDQAGPAQVLHTLKEMEARRVGTHV